MHPALSSRPAFFAARKIEIFDGQTKLVVSWVFEINVTVQRSGGVTRYAPRSSPAR